MRALVLVALLLAVGCKPDKTVASQYSVSLEEALESSQVPGLTLETESLVLARLGANDITAGELARALQSLPPHVRYFFSSPEKAQLFMQDYVILNVAAREGLKLGPDLRARATLLAALERQVREDYLAQHLKYTGHDDDLQEQSKILMANRIEELRQQTTVTIDEGVLAAFEQKLSATEETR